MEGAVGAKSTALGWGPGPNTFLHPVMLTNVQGGPCPDGEQERHLLC